MEQTQIKNSNNTCWTCGSMHQSNNCSTNVTQFIWKNGGKNIFLSGSWNKWQASVQLNPMPQNKRWHQVTLSLPCGTYYYKYIIDGQWVYDQNELKISDGLQGYNNILEVIPKYFTVDETTETEQSDIEIQQQLEKEQQDQLKKQSVLPINISRKVKISTCLDAESILLIGSWDEWKEQIPMTRKFNNILNRWENEKDVSLTPGKYYFKFILNGIYVCDNQLKMVKNDLGSFNNLIYVPKINPENYHKKMLFNPHALKWKSEVIYNIGSEKLFGHTINLIGDSLYIYAGQRDIGKYRDCMYELNLQTWDIDTVEYDSMAPPQRAFHSSITYGDKILILGGNNEETILQDCWAFNISYQTWEKYDLNGHKPSKREKSSLTYYKQKQCIILFGGYYCTEDLEAEYHFNDMYSLTLNNMIWTQINIAGEKPAPRFAAGMEIFKSVIFLFGGLQYLNASPYKYFDDLWTLDLNPNNTQTQWKNLSQSVKGQGPSPRYGLTMQRMSHYFVIFGGRGKNNQYFNDTWILDSKNLEWIFPKIYGADPSPRYFHTATKINEYEIVIMGGNQHGTRKQRKIHILSCVPEEDSDEENHNKNKHKNKIDLTHHQANGQSKFKQILKLSSQDLDKVDQQNSNEKLFASKI